MNAGRILCSILLGMYAIYIIRNNTITIAGANTKRSLLLLAVIGIYKKMIHYHIQSTLV